MNYLSAINIGQEFFRGGTVGPINNKLMSLTSISDFVTFFLNASFIIAGVLLLFYFVIGGIGMISGAGSDNPQELQKGKQAATSALFGFIVVFASYWIVKLIERLTGITILGN